MYVVNKFTTNFKVACETFCLDENDMVKDAKKALGDVPLTEETVRFGKYQGNTTLKAALEASFRKQLITCKVKENKNLGDFSADRATVFVDMQPEVSMTLMLSFLKFILTDGWNC